MTIILISNPVNMVGRYVSLFILLDHSYEIIFCFIISSVVAAFYILMRLMAKFMSITLQRIRDSWSGRDWPVPAVATAYGIADQEYRRQNSWLLKPAVLSFIIWISGKIVLPDNHLKKREEGSMPASMYCRSKVYYHSQSDIAEKDPGLSETICHKEEKAGAAGDQGNYSFPFKTMDSISIFPFSWIFACDVQRECPDVDSLYFIWAMKYYRLFKRYL